MSDIRTVKLPQIPWSEITYNEKDCLGEGGFGIVYTGKWKHGGQVAIKKIKGVMEKDAIEELQTETGIMAQLNSPYIIRLFGLCWDRQNYGIVMELMPKGSLYHLLRNNQELPWNIRYRISMDIAYGLRLLHDRNILHRDVKSLNVLLDDRLRAKLTDFGLAKIKSQSSATTRHQGSVGTVAWMAPELFEGETTSRASDLYAYGMVNWEIYSRKLPYEKVSPQALPFVITKGKRPDIGEDCPEEFSSLIKSCWSQEKEKRPTMDEVVASLESIIGKNKPEEVKPVIPDNYQDEDLESFGVLTVQLPKTHPTLSHTPETAEPVASNTKEKINTVPVEINKEDQSAQQSSQKDNSKHIPHPASIAPYSKGLDYYNDKKYKEAIKHFTKAALQGNWEAQNMLGFMYNNGQGVEQNFSLAQTWWNKAASQGNAESQNNLGFLFYYGKGITQDYSQAKDLYEKAAVQGHPEAQNSLAFMYQHGKGVSQDLGQAKYWYEQAAGQGHGYAIDELNEFRDVQAVRPAAPTPK